MEVKKSEIANLDARRGQGFLLGLVVALSLLFVAFEYTTQPRPAEDNDELRQMATGKYAGVGSIIRYNQKEQRAMFIEPYEGTPSQVAGIRAGDVILSIDGTDVKGKMTDVVSNMLRGEGGTSLEVKVKRPNVEEPITFHLKRQTIQLPACHAYSGTRRNPSAAGSVCKTAITHSNLSAASLRR